MKVIYAIIHKDEIIYVGKTQDLKKRINGHRSGGPCKRFVKKGATAHIIRTCDDARSGQIEAQIIAAFKRRGLCRLNRAGHIGRERIRKHLQKEREDAKKDQKWLEAAALHRKLSEIYKSLGDSLHSEKHERKASDIEFYIDCGRDRLARLEHTVKVGTYKCPRYLPETVEARVYSPVTAKVEFSNGE